MDNNGDGDQIMEDGPVLLSTEMNSTVPESLDPSVLQVSQEGYLSSPELIKKGNGLSNGLHHPSADPAPDSQLDKVDDMAYVKKEAYLPLKRSPLPYSSSQSGLVYDVRMRFHVEPIPKDEDIHPEDPRRIFEVYKELSQAGLVDDPLHPEFVRENQVLLRIPARHATEAEILACHNWDEETLTSVAAGMDSVYLSVNTPGCALLAAGGAIEAARAVMNQQVKNSIAVIRPPGHHAEHNHPMGFCFFNNVPVAARAVQKEFGEAARKVFILDWDVHHGNGVQNIFYEDPNVLYISIHVSQNGTFYPGGDGKDHLHCGAGAGLGKNVNIPWRLSGMGDGDYIYAFQEVVMPIAQDFDPDIVFVCAGFDAAEGDMLGGCHVTPAGYAHMTHMLMSLADGKLVVCMEGGYNLRSIAASALAVTKTLMGEPPERLQSSQPSPTGVDDVKMVLRQQSKFWPCLYPKDPAERLHKQQGDRLHDIIRFWQANELFRQHEMISLFVARNKKSPSSENQVLATPHYAEARPLLLTFHDPPLMTGTNDARTLAVDPHNTFVVSNSLEAIYRCANRVVQTDLLRQYIDHVVSQGFSVIDVNIPKHYTSVQDAAEHSEPSSPEERERDALKLATYLWENYLELSDASHIFVLGVGAAYKAIIELLKYNERIPPRISKIFFFVADQSLHSCRSATDENLGYWYYDTSLVFVAQNHQIWKMTGESGKKPKKRFGKLVPSLAESLEDMLAEHKEKVFDVMREESYGWERNLEQQRGADSSGDGSEDGLMSSKRAGADALRSPEKMPPVGNFAISPKKR